MRNLIQGNLIGPKDIVVHLKVPTVLEIIKRSTSLEKYRRTFIQYWSSHKQNPPPSPPAEI